MNNQVAIACMVVGRTVTIIYLYLSRFKGVELFGIKPIASGIFGMPLNFIVALLISRLTPAPPEKLQTFVDSIRYPKGAVKAGAEE
ncbi:MAG: hypothetical protein N2648_03315 [Aquificaceae bacterium]|nr:hypothetical protein [Aquificaceae bacterium]